MTGRGRSVLAAAAAAWLSGAGAVAQGPIDAERVGLAAGARAPAFSGVDQHGHTRTLTSLMGREGAMLVFTRSTASCASCRTQLLELRDRRDAIEAQGLGLAAIVPDAPEVLRQFAAEQGIAYPLIADRDSAILRRYGLASGPGEPGRGGPHPATFVVAPDLRVRARVVAEAPEERRTAASLLAHAVGWAGDGPAVTRATAHLRLTARATDAVVSPGSRFAIVFDVAPGRGMHVYAPGRHSYQVIAVEFDPHPWLTVHPLKYPPPEIYHFEPLDERVEVYMTRFRLVQDLTIGASAAAQQRLAGSTAVTIAGRVRYQACDDKVCYNPVTIPVSWTLELRPRRP